VRAIFDKLHNNKCTEIKLQSTNDGDTKIYRTLKVIKILLFQPVGVRHNCTKWYHFI